MKITGKELARELQQALNDVPSETLFEVNSLLGLYNITSFDHIQDVFEVEED